MQIGRSDKNIYGYLLPKLVFVLSEKVPIAGSEKASNKRANSTAEPVKSGFRPKNVK